MSSPGLVKHFQSYSRDTVERIHPSPGSLIIEIGSNDGTLLGEFKKHGLRVLGIDPARKIAQSATKSGIETLPEFFSLPLAKRLKKKYGQASIIAANNVVANIDDLHEFLEGIKELLDPSGVFIFESFYLLDLMKNMVFDFIFHEHYSYFSIQPLLSFFKNHGMEFIDIKRVATKGGSLRYFVQFAGGPRKVSSRVVALSTHEAKFKLNKIETYKDFAYRIDRAKRKLQQLLKKLEQQKKTITGFGASHTTTTLLYHFNLNKHIKFLIDENPSKLNTYSPGFHIPVFPTQVMYSKSPDYIVILAWRFANSIVAKNKKFTRDGGHFIIPLPRLRII